jgi:hypothetical protein
MSSNVRCTQAPRGALEFTLIGSKTNLANSYSRVRYRARSGFPGNADNRCRRRAAGRRTVIHEIFWQTGAGFAAGAFRDGSIFLQLSKLVAPCARTSMARRSARAGIPLARKNAPALTKPLARKMSEGFGNK